MTLTPIRSDDATNRNFSGIFGKVRKVTIDSGLIIFIISCECTVFGINKGFLLVIVIFLLLLRITKARRTLTNVVTLDTCSYGISVIKTKIVHNVAQRSTLTFTCFCYMTLNNLFNLCHQMNFQYLRCKCIIIKRFFRLPIF